MPITEEAREAKHIEIWRVAVCDTCGKREDVAGPDDRNTIYSPVPATWTSVYDGISCDLSLVFCSTDCLKAYH